jgi:hypothetical protein
LEELASQSVPNRSSGNKNDYATTSAQFLSSDKKASAAFTVASFGFSTPDCLRWRGILDCCAIYSPGKAIYREHPATKYQTD